MAHPRVDAHRLRELIRLRRFGTSARQASRLLRLSPKTERKYRVALAQADLLAGSPDALPSIDAIRVAVARAFPPPPRRPSTVEPWREQVESLLAKGLKVRAVFDRLRLEPAARLTPFRGTYSAVKRLVRRLRAEHPDPARVAVPIPTAPGQEAQVDFGYAGRLYDPATGVLRRAWVFVMLLCHSRYMFLEVVFDQKTQTWLDLHEQAFRFFGGVPHTLIPDNTKRAVLRAAFGLDGSTELERSYRELAQGWGFQIDPAPLGDPRTRGKVEAAVKYVRNNPLKGRDGEDVTHVRAALQRWNREVAAVRVHGTTRRQPLEVFVDEDQPALAPLPGTPGAKAIWKRAKVHPDAHVTCSGKLFSVPWQLVHEQVWVRKAGLDVEVFHHDQLVATHQDRGQRRTTLDAHLPQDRRLLRHRSRAFWEGRAKAIGPYTSALVQLVFNQDQALSHLRQVQAVVRLLERVPRRRAERLSQRAILTGDICYSAVRQEMAEGHDLLGIAEHQRISEVVS